MSVKNKRAARRQDPYRWYWRIVSIMLVLLAIFLVWGRISWLFNYNVISQALTDAFSNHAPAARSVTPVTTIQKQPAAGDNAVISSSPKTETAATPTPRPDSVTVPKIGISVPIVTAQTTDVNGLHKLLDSGVVLYPGSAAFGTNGQTVLLGHSAPAGWPNIKYDWVFTKLNQLTPGDVVVVNYNNHIYYYSVVGTKVIAAGGDLPASTVTGNSLVLVSCWPPGKDYKRIAVETALNQ